MISEHVCRKCMPKCMAMCVNTCAEMCIEMYIDPRRAVGIDMCIDM